MNFRKKKKIRVINAYNRKKMCDHFLSSLRFLILILIKHISSHRHTRTHGIYSFFFIVISFNGKGHQTHPHSSFFYTHNVRTLAKCLNVKRQISLCAESEIQNVHTRRR